jgi:hypothetical protein
MIVLDAVVTTFFMRVGLLGEEPRRSTVDVHGIETDTHCRDLSAKQSDVPRLRLR